MMKTIPLKDGEIEYLLTGEGPSEVILFIHGLGANLSQFQCQHEYFSPDYRVISVNLRGHGKSRIFIKPTPTEFELHKMALDVIAVLDALKIDRVYFVGNSMGGNVGYEILKLKPSLFSSFTTFGTTAQLSTSKFTLWVMNYTYKILPIRAIGTLAKAAGQTTASKQKIKKMMSQVSKLALLSALPNIANFNYLSVIKTSSVPSMIIKGEFDRSINQAIESTLDEFKKKDDFKLAEVKGVGHFANLDNPDRFNQILGEFIDDRSKTITRSTSHLP
ncbi:MAG: alpha/beta hydrolase [Bacteroidota bacterium]